ncbi:MAG: hypothetical protein ACYDD1_19585 [Caulobacteraceae bacterium]
MNNQPQILRAAVGLMAGVVVAQESQTSFAASVSSASPTFGGWQERDMKIPFEVRPGATPKQIIVVIPKDVEFPGNHQFVLTKAPDGAYQAIEHDRPRVSLVVNSPLRANLSVRGSGTTSSGTWVSMNDFTLVRP